MPDDEVRQATNGRCRRDKRQHVGARTFKRRRRQVNQGHRCGGTAPLGEHGAVREADCGARLGDGAGQVRLLVACQ
jgi:hypothetical protein